MLAKTVQRHTYTASSRAEPQRAPNRLLSKGLQSSIGILCGEHIHWGNTPGRPISHHTGFIWCVRSMGKPHINLHLCCSKRGLYFLCPFDTDDRSGVDIGRVSGHVCERLDRINVLSKDGQVNSLLDTFPCQDLTTWLDEQHKSRQGEVRFLLVLREFAAFPSIKRPLKGRCRCASSHRLAPMVPQELEQSSSAMRHLGKQHFQSRRIPAMHCAIKGVSGWKIQVEHSSRTQSNRKSLVHLHQHWE